MPSLSQGYKLVQLTATDEKNLHPEKEGENQQEVAVAGMSSWRFGEAGGTHHKSWWEEAESSQ